MKNHAVYDKAARGEYLSVTDAAKLARLKLKQEFPNTKFSVTSDKYAGGSSMRIRWTDGPTAKLVEQAVAPLEGKGFDGMVDYAYYKSTWIMPDGSFFRAGSQGSAVTGGMHEGFKTERPCDDAIEINFGCYVFCEREHSEQAHQRTLQSYAARYSDELTEAIDNGDVRVKVTDYGHAHFEGAGQIRPGGGAEWGDIVLWRAMQRRMELPL